MNQNWIQFIRESTKQSFELLRNQSPIFCPLLKNNVIVSKKFFNHISQSKKRKENISEQIERLLIIPFIENIIHSGVCIEIRKEEKEESVYFFRLEKIYKNKKFAIIIEKKDEVFRLLSCFNVYNKKELVSVSIDPSLIEKKIS